MPEGYEILGHLFNIMQVGYIVGMKLREEVFIKNGFPMLHCGVYFNFSVHQIQNVFSIVMYRISWS